MNLFGNFEKVAELRNCFVISQSLLVRYLWCTCSFLVASCGFLGFLCISCVLLGGFTWDLSSCGFSVNFSCLVLLLAVSIEKDFLSCL